MRKPSPATIIASVALFFSLAGTGIAASRYLITSVSQIKPSVRQSLTGQPGPIGLQGPQGITGATGTFNWNQTYFAVSEAVLTPTHPIAELTVSCNPGDHALNGGYGGWGEIVTESYPTPTQDGWVVVAHLNLDTSLPVIQQGRGDIRAVVQCSP